MIDDLQGLKSKTKLKFNEDTRIYCDEMEYHRQNSTFQFEEDFNFAENVQNMGKFMHEVIIFVKFLRNKP